MRLDKNFKKLSKLFPGDKSLIEAFGKVNGHDLENLFAVFNGQEVSASVTILDTQYQHHGVIPGQRESSGAPLDPDEPEHAELQSFKAKATLYGDNQEVLGELPTEKFKEVQNVEESGLDLNAYIVQYLEEHWENYISEPDPPDREDDRYFGNDF